MVHRQRNPRRSVQCVSRISKRDRLTVSGHFVWVDIGGALGFRDLATEKRIFQNLLDGGVYIVRQAQVLQMNVNS
jgi:hypothetical protein